MGYTNSKLVNHKNLSPNHYNGRNHTIDTITIHCVVGQCSVESLGNIFASASRQASSNYGVGYDGRIGLYVEEKNASWCSSNYANDNRAITIEVASDTYDPYAVTEKAYNALIKLVADICKRNGIKQLKWSTNKSDRMNHRNGCNMTVHRDYANKSCPGDYLYNRMGDIAKKVNALLGASSSTTPANSTETKITTTSVKAGDVVKIASGATYYTGKAVPAWVQKKNWIVKEVKGDRAVVDKSEDGKNAICSAINTKFLSVVKKAAASTSSSFKAYRVKVTADALNVRKGAGTNYAKTGCITNGGVYTIVDEKDGWGKLKSGLGWICLAYTKKV